MASDEVRTTLKNEADLLAQMIEFVGGVSDKGYTNQARFIKDSWARFLGERRDAALTLCKASDENLQNDLLNEFSQVKAYVEATHKDPDYTEHWRKFLECEQDILRHLVSRCDSY